jgi:hypothetical protein
MFFNFFIRNFMEGLMQYNLASLMVVLAATPAASTESYLNLTIAIATLAAIDGLFFLWTVSSSFLRNLRMSFLSRIAKRNTELYMRR